MRNFCFLTGLLFLVISCDLFRSKPQPKAIARVDDFYLYSDEIENLVPEGASKEDSISIVKNYMDRWATQKLLIQGAMVNLSTEKQEAYDKLVQQYKDDLYTKGYLEEIVKHSIDTAVSQQELKTYYNLNKDNFRINGALVRLRYIHLPQDHPKFELIKSKFFDFKKNDVKFWETYQLQFKDYALNDSVWVEVNQVYRKLPFITPDNREDFIQPGKSIQQPDAPDVYLVKIGSVLEKNQVGPFEYIKPTLKELIINQRKLELIKRIEKEITDDAIKNKNYEIYN